MTKFVRQRLGDLLTNRNYNCVGRMVACRQRVRHPAIQLSIKPIDDYVQKIPEDGL